MITQITLTFLETSATQSSCDAEIIETIKAARIASLLQFHGFTGRLANKPEPEPIRDDKSGAYEMSGLDGLLIAPSTKLYGLKLPS